jgi:hypothetical protein
VADASAPRGSADGWGPSTSVRSASADESPGYAGSRSSRSTDGNALDAAFYPQAYPQPSRTRASARERLQAVGQPAARERGLPGWGGLLVLVGMTTLGILFDTVRGHQLALGFNVGIISGAVIAILVVRRSGMFPVVVAPPIVYSLGAGISLYIRSGGLSDRSVLIDAATNWLVYGFPAIAAATASVLIIGGIRLVVRR